MIDNSFITVIRFWAFLVSCCYGSVVLWVGFGIFDANNMPILCQFVAPQYRATAYGIMNMVGVFAGAFITNFLGASADEGKLGSDFAMLAGIVFVVLLIQLTVLKPKAHEQLA